MSSTSSSSSLTASIAFVSGGLAVATLALSVIAAGSALAQTAPASTVQVSTAGFDPASPEDARELERRIDVAARQACGNVVVHSPLEPRASAECRKVASEEARGQVERPTTLASR